MNSSPILTPINSNTANTNKTSDFPIFKSIKTEISSKYNENYNYHPKKQEMINKNNDRNNILEPQKIDSSTQKVNKELKEIEAILTRKRNEAKKIISFEPDDNNYLPQLNLQKKQINIKQENDDNYLNLKIKTLPTQKKRIIPISNPNPPNLLTKKPEPLPPKQEKNQILFTCTEGCDRKFNKKAFEKHIKICKKVFQTKKNTISNPTTNEIKQLEKPKNWKKQSEAFRQVIKATKNQFFAKKNS